MSAELFLAAADRLTARDFDAFAELLHPDVITSGLDDWPEPGPFHGRGPALGQFERIVADFDAQRVSDFEVVAEGVHWSVVEYRWHVRGAGSQVETHFDLAVGVRVDEGLLAELHFRRTRTAALATLAGIRPCRGEESRAILAIVNAAAEAYRGVIPADRWHEPYMPAEELDEEIAAGVDFWGYEAGGQLLGVMGIQPVRDVDLIRHAYVLPESQGRGVGRALLEHLLASATRRVLVGTWTAAQWAVDFYLRHGFAKLGPEQTAELLREYWSIPERQVATSVVLERKSSTARD